MSNTNELKVIVHDLEEIMKRPVIAERVKELMEREAEENLLQQEAEDHLRMRNQQ